ncbi:hypothetical protein MKX54_06895 [Alkalihalobacillus sp. FSL R5-0424]
MIINCIQDQHIHLSRIETYRLKSKTKRNKWLKWIGFFLFFCFAVAIEYYTKEFLPKENGTVIYSIGVIIRVTTHITLGSLFYLHVIKKK